MIVDGENSNTDRVQPNPILSASCRCLIEATRKSFSLQPSEAPSSTKGGASSCPANNIYEHEESAPYRVQKLD